MIGLGLGIWSSPAVVSSGGGGGSTTWGTQADWTIAGLQATRSAISTFWGLLHASAAKTNGTAIFTITTAGPAVIHCGLDTGAEANNLGNDNTGQSISYSSDGHIGYVNSNISSTVATYTTGDVIKVAKAGNIVTFYKNNVSQMAVDLTDAGWGATNPCTGAVYPSVDTFHQTGAVITADFSGW